MNVCSYSIFTKSPVKRPIACCVGILVRFSLSAGVPVAAFLSPWAIACHSGGVKTSGGSAVSSMLRFSLAGFLAVSLVAACGRGSSGPELGSASPPLTHQQYQQAIQDIVTSDDARIAGTLYSAAVATTLEKGPCEKTVRGLHEHLSSIVGAVEALTAPADARAAQSDFLAAAQESVRLVAKAADDVGDGDLTCGQPLNQRIYALPSTMRAEKAIAELEGLGYRVFGD